MILQIVETLGLGASFVVLMFTGAYILQDAQEVSRNTYNWKFLKLQSRNAILFLTVLVAMFIVVIGFMVVWP